MAVPVVCAAARGDAYRASGRVLPESVEGDRRPMRVLWKEEEALKARHTPYEDPRQFKGI